jgi:hypothetical protein
MELLSKFVLRVGECVEAETFKYVNKHKYGQRVQDECNNYYWMK